MSSVSKNLNLITNNIKSANSAIVKIRWISVVMSTILLLLSIVITNFKLCFVAAVLLLLYWGLCTHHTRLKEVYRMVYVDAMQGDISLLEIDAYKKRVSFIDVAFKRIDTVAFYLPSIILFVLFASVL